MTEWLHFANTSNRLTRTYMNEFLDVSGNIILRNGDLTLFSGNAGIGRDLDVSGNTHIKGDL